MFEIPYVYGSVFVPVNGIQIVAGNGVRFQWIVHQVGKKFGQGVVNEQPHMAGKYPYVAVSQVEDALHAIVLYVSVIVQGLMFPTAVKNCSCAKAGCFGRCIPIGFRFGLCKCVAHDSPAKVYRWREWLFP